MRNRTYGGVRGRKTKVGRKLLRFPPTRSPKWAVKLSGVCKEFNLRKAKDYSAEISCIQIFRIFVLM